MTNTTVSAMTDKYVIYFEGFPISKERIFKEYANFLAAEITNENRSMSIALHTGSICFDIVSLVTASIGCILLDKTNTEEVISSFADGDIVIYKNERHRWLGLETIDGNRYIKLQQDKRGKIALTTLWVSYESDKGLVEPYLGESENTGGRGIKKLRSGRNDFISYILGVPKIEIPSETGVSTVIVTEKDYFKRIAKGIKIKYENGKTIGLLDLVTASYFTDSGEEHRYAGNSAKTEPVLKITSNITTARGLVLDKRGNKIVGLMVIGADSAAKGGSELSDLLGRKSQRFVHVSTNIDYKDAEKLVESQPQAAVFACTKKFLSDNSFFLKKQNRLANELARQIDNNLNNTITVVTVTGGCSWEEMRKAKETLRDIGRSEWNEGEKNQFIISAYSLLNLLSTAVFPMRILENSVSVGKLNVDVVSPKAKIEKLWSLAEKAGYMKDECVFVIDVIELFYKSLFEQCPKYDALYIRITQSVQERIAIVVPKAYYVDVLAGGEQPFRSGVDLITANQFDTNAIYDEIIVVGDIVGKRFDPLRCKTAKGITVFLYESEINTFRYKSNKAEKFEKRLNIRRTTFGEGTTCDVSDIANEPEESDYMLSYIECETDLEHYLERIVTFDIRRYVTRLSATAGNAPTSEIYAVGKFTSGERILFSKYYDAVIYDLAQGTVTEANQEQLVNGDVLIFAKKDDYTRNMVDYIYDGLMSGNKLSNAVLDATEKARYWKNALRKYKNANGLSYNDIASRLRKLGSSIQASSVRHWLIKESHIVGPRRVQTLEQIAKLTNDPNLLRDARSFFEACRIVRRHRMEILKLISEAITDRLGGQVPPKGTSLENVYENVENLSVLLELESISMLDEPITVPVNIINKPLTDAEVSI